MDILDRGRIQILIALTIQHLIYPVKITVKPDLIHSRGEERYFALGKTNTNRTLVVIFTVRKTKMRVITARDAHKKERIRYET